MKKAVITGGFFWGMLAIGAAESVNTQQVSLPVTIRVQCVDATEIEVQQSIYRHILYLSQMFDDLEPQEGSTQPLLLPPCVTPVDFSMVIELLNLFCANKHNPAIDKQLKKLNIQELCAIACGVEWLEIRVLRKQVIMTLSDRVPHFSQEDYDYAAEHLPAPLQGLIVSKSLPVHPACGWLLQHCPMPIRTFPFSKWSQPHYQFTLSPDGSKAAFIGFELGKLLLGFGTMYPMRCFYLCDATTGACIKKIKLGPAGGYNNDGDCDFVFSPDSKLLCFVSTRKHVVKIIDAKTGELVKKCPYRLNTENIPVIMQFSPDVRHVVFFDLNDIVLWRIADNIVTSINNVVDHRMKVGFSGDGSKFFMFDKYAVNILDLLHDTVAENKSVLSKICAVARNGDYVAIIKKRKGAEQYQCVEMLNIVTGASFELTGHGSYNITNVTFSSNGKQLLIGYDGFDGIEIWDLKSGGKCARVKASKPQCLKKEVVFSPDLLLYAHQDVSLVDGKCDDDYHGCIQLYQTHTHRLVKEFDGKVHPVFFDHGKKLLCMQLDKQVFYKIDLSAAVELSHELKNLSLIHLKTILNLFKHAEANKQQLTFAPMANGLPEMMASLQHHAPNLSRALMGTGVIETPGIRQRFFNRTVMTRVATVLAGASLLGYLYNKML